MKKIFGILTFLTVVGCSNEVFIDEAIQNNDQIPVSFNTFTSKQTRAENSSATDVNNLETYNTTFKVWGSKYVVENSTSKEYSVFAGDKVSFATATDWTYSPIRFWDKAATSYDFYAAAPSGKSWVWNNTTKKLSLADFSLSGFNSVTGTPATTVAPDKVLTESLDTEDLMISTDVTGYNTYTSTAVNLHFNHILSRLNIGVRKASILDTFVVKLNSIKVYNMKSNGSFDESKASGTTLAAGTIARWEDATTSTTFTTGIGYTPATALEVTSTATAPASYQYVYEGLVIPQAVEYNPTKEVANYVADQTPAHFKLDGSNATTTSAPYIVIDYEIWSKTGAAKVDAYKYYYNLADVFNGDETSDVNFYEGWQNTLMITLSPVAINFDADVYQWATKENVEVYVTDAPAP